MAGWGLLSGVLSWRRASAVVVGLVLAFGGLGVATAAVTDRPTVPQVTVSYNGVELQNCWDTTSCPQIAVMGESVTVTLTATSPDVVRFQYGFVGGGVETVDGSTATLTLFPRQEGYNRLQVVSINSIGQPSEQLDFMFNVAPRPGPVGSWSFDDGSGTTAADGPGLTHPLTLSGGAAFDGKGRLNGAVALDGVNDVVQATDPVVDTSKSFSISAWARPTSSTKNGVVAAITGTNSSAFGLYYDAASKRWVFARTSADVRTPTLYRAASKEAPINGAWTHLTGTYDVTTGNLQLFVNGRLQQTATSPVAPAWKAAGPLTIGRGKYAAADTGYFAGSLDQIKLWQRPLVAEEVPALADPRTPDEPVSALAAHWPLDSATRGTDHVWRTAECDPRRGPAAHRFRQHRRPVGCLRQRPGTRPGTRDDRQGAREPLGRPPDRRRQQQLHRRRHGEDRRPVQADGHRPAVEPPPRTPGVWNTSRSTPSPLSGCSPARPPTLPPRSSRPTPPTWIPSPAGISSSEPTMPPIRVSCREDPAGAIKVTVDEQRR